MNDFFVLLDDALQGQSRLYRDYVRADFLRAGELERLDECLAAGQAAGLYAVLLADYAFGEALHDMAADGVLALYWFAACEYQDAAQTESWFAAQDDGQAAGVAELSADTDRTAYVKTIDAIQAAIARGETYQINYTYRLNFTVYGAPLALYRRLRARQPVPYGALAYLPDDQGAAFCLLSCSPELFVRCDGRTITAEPMKGTAAMKQDGQDEARRLALQNDAKNRAENVMIVDLLRNDLGKVAETGSVSVPQRFAVNAFGAVWQMTSTVRAQLRADTGAAALVQAIYPCGSITGAPKRKSMEIIRALETSPRGFYTGALGFLEKTEEGFNACLNVLIRTLTLREQDGIWRGQMGIGSGIVADSRGEDEWAECALKAGFVSGLQPQFGLIETMRFERGQCDFLARHLDRLCASAQALGFVCERAQIRQALRAYVAALPQDVPQRVRLCWHASGQCALTAAALQPLPAANMAVMLADEPLTAHYLYRHKTDARKVYDKGLQQAQEAGAFDLLYCNAAGELLEGARSNVFVRLNGQWYTPPLSLGILPGVMRAEVLAHPQRYLAADSVTEAVLSRVDVEQAEALALSNALRGVVSVRLL